jgi:hypothetical protein
MKYGAVCSGRSSRKFRRNILLPSSVSMIFNLLFLFNYLFLSISSTLKIEIIRFCEGLVNINRTTRRHIPEYDNLYSHC